MRFSSRVDISEPNPIAVEEAAAKRQGVTLGKLNDSNPTRHGLAPASVPEVYSAEPKGQRYAREALATFLNGRGNGRCESDDLYILSSTSEAYSWLIKLLCDAGDAEPMKGCMPGKSSGYCSAETSDGLPGVEPGHVNADG
mgnify:CR=1 FL=1